MASISFPKELFDELLSHLERPEEVAFMLADPPTNGCFRIRDLRIISCKRHLDDSTDRANLDDSIRSEVIQWAWETDACLVEAHSHGRWFLPVQFSGFDLDQFVDWVPHVRWRLRGRPYAALVTAGTQLDGLAWFEETPEMIESVLVDGRDPILTSGVSADRLRRQHE